MSRQSSTDLTLSDVTIRFGEFAAVSDASIKIDPGDFFTLLGPSGCGKTTLLRTIAGFNRQSSGSVVLGDAVIDDVPAHKRDTGMVFQSYAVFPHLSVWDNVKYGLKARGVRGREADTRIRESLTMVDLDGYEDRMPNKLSGGQQQRVVIARAVAIRPRILLMDEPLANLDAKLRVRLRNDLKRLQKSLGITTVYVTHDQEEALSLSDRIAVMSAGRVLQIGAPEEIYNHPETIGVAQFIGEGTFLRGTLQRTDTTRPTVEMGGMIRLPVDCSAEITWSGDTWVGIRPQDVSIVPAADGALSGKVIDKTYLGSYVRYDVDCGLSSTVAVEVTARNESAALDIAQEIGLDVHPSRLLLFPGQEKKEDL